MINIDQIVKPEIITMDPVATVALTIIAMMIVIIVFFLVFVMYISYKEKTIADNHSRKILKSHLNYSYGKFDKTRK